ncbi:MAG: hypothetical protein R6X10_13705 [Desulfobacterales bacterium]
MGFFKENWIAILSLIIALAGGIPGILAIVNQIKAHPVLSFQLVNIITGQQLNPITNQTTTMVLITGTASNEGDVAMTPAYFELAGTINNKKIEFEKTLIQGNPKFYSEEQSISVDEPSKKDLQRYGGTISKGMPLYGHLMFLAHNISLDDLRSNLDRLKLSLIGVDVFGKRYRAPIQLYLHAKDDGGTEFPKHGLKIQPKL